MRPRSERSCGRGWAPIKFCGFTKTTPVFPFRSEKQLMCSISGIVQGTGVEKMIAAQKHRAPDESGIYRDTHLELGMGRLKIIDMKSPGLAPYQEEGLVLAYN